MMMRQKVVGVYECGWEQIEVVLREGTGGEFWFLPKKGSVPRIKVGADQEWRYVVSGLVHEVMEFQLSRLRCRYESPDDLGRDHSSYIFVYNHNQHSDCAACLADFLVRCLPDMSGAWKKWRKKSKKGG